MGEGEEDVSLSAGDIADTNSAVDNTVVCFDGLIVIVHEVEDAVDEVIWGDLTESTRLVIGCIANGVADGVFNGGFGWWYGFKVGWWRVIEVKCDFDVYVVGSGCGNILSGGLIEGYATEWTAGAGAEPLEEAFALKDVAASVYLEDLFVEVEGFLRDGAFGVYGLDDITIPYGGGVIIYFGLGESALV